MSREDNVVRVASSLQDSFNRTILEVVGIPWTNWLTDISQIFILPSLPVLAIHPRLSPFPVPQSIEYILLV